MQNVQSCSAAGYPQAEHNLLVDNRRVIDHCGQWLFLLETG
jgi:hypothetical protein